jgi:lipoyl(octanoyl) transferase
MNLEVKDLGRAPSYQAVWDLQTAHHKAIVDWKIARRKAGEDETVDAPDRPPNALFFVEHEHVLTLGKSGKEAHLVASPERLEELGVEYVPINRGGDITYHGPGQIVAYPILDLELLKPDIGWYMRSLEEAIIRTCADFGLETGRIEGLTGVWLDIERDPRKIAALGVKTSRWVTMHGLAFNVNTDLAFFNLIVPCGIQGKGVTSLQKELGQPVDHQRAQSRLQHHLLDLLSPQLK